LFKPFDTPPVDKLAKEAHKYLKLFNS